MINHSIESEMMQFQDKSTTILYVYLEELIKYSNELFQGYKNHHKASQCNWDNYGESERRVLSWLRGHKSDYPQWESNFASLSKAFVNLSKVSKGCSDLEKRIKAFGSLVERALELQEKLVCNE